MIKSTSLFMDDEREWVLLRASLEQEGNNGTRIAVYVNTLLIDSEFAKPFREYYFQRDFYLRGIPDYLYLFAGEIPWSQNLSYEKDVIELDGSQVEIYFPFLFYLWEFSRSPINDIGHIPFVSKQIADEFHLQYNVRDVSYYTQSGKSATKFLWDDYSHYLYIRKDLLLEFMKKHGLSLLWVERGSRYGDYGNMKPTFNPSLKDFSSVKVM